LVATGQLDRAARLGLGFERQGLLAALHHQARFGFDGRIFVDQLERARARGGLAGAGHDGGHARSALLGAQHAAVVGLGCQLGQGGPHPFVGLAGQVTGQVAEQDHALVFVGQAAQGRASERDGGD
jgi:hypothetical protein